MGGIPHQCDRRKLWSCASHGLRQHTPRKINMDSKNHRIEKEMHLANLHVWLPCFFPGRNLWTHFKKKLNQWISWSNTVNTLENYALQFRGEICKSYNLHPTTFLTFETTCFGSLTLYYKLVSFTPQTNTKNTPSKFQEFLLHLHLRNWRANNFAHLHGEV